jgi:hypothetical protein
MIQDPVSALIEACRERMRAATARARRVTSGGQAVTIGWLFYGY